MPVSEPTLNRAIRSGDLPVHRIGRRVLIPTAELLRWAGVDATGNQAAPPNRHATGTSTGNAA